MAVALAAVLVGTTAALGGSNGSGGRHSGPDLAHDPVIRATDRASDKRAARRAARLSTPKARDRRRKSRSAYKHLGRAASLRLAKRSFDEVLGTPVWHGLQPGNGGQVRRYVDDFTAELDTDESGDKQSLAVSTLPLRTRDADGDLVPVDLGLQTSGDAEVPRAPLVPTRIAKQARGGVTLGSSAIGVRPAGAVDSEGTVFSDRLFFHDIGGAPADTDFLIEPTDTGAQLMWQLRSAQSPERLSLTLDLPNGAKLRDSDRFPGGAEIVDGSEVLALIYPPAAVDADGTSLATSYAISKDTLTVQLSHRSEPVRYPILIDPVVNVMEDFYNGNWLWSGWWAAAGGSVGMDAWLYPAYDNGLSLWAKHNVNYQINDFIAWYWQAPLNAFIYRADFTSLIWYRAMSPALSPPYPECTDKAQHGLWSTQQGQWEGGNNAFHQDENCWIDKPDYALPAICAHGTCEVDYGTEQNMAFAGLSSRRNGDGHTAVAGMARTVLYLRDRRRPKVLSTQQGLNEDAINQGRWLGSGVNFSTTVRGTDWGLGIERLELVNRVSERKIGVWGSDGNPRYLGCHWGVAPHDTTPGSNGYTDPGHDVGDRHNRCKSAQTTPYDWPPTPPPGKTQEQVIGEQSDLQTFDYSTDHLDEGVHTYGVDAYDVIGIKSEPPESGWTVKVDRTDPDLSLSGELYARRYSPRTPPDAPQTLAAGDYNLHMKATDGLSAPSPNTKSGSGVTKLQVFVRARNPDGSWQEHGPPRYEDSEECPDFQCETELKPKFDESQPCPDGNCQMDRNWTFSTKDYAPGEYKITVTATDQVPHSRSQEFTVNVGAAPQTDFSDKLGLEDWFQYDSTETGAGTRAHVNLATGNLVWHSVPLVNQGRGLSSVANVTYNSQVRPDDVPRGFDLGYNQVGRGFSLGISGLTRVNEPLDVTTAALGFITMTDSDGTRHRFTRTPDDPDTYSPPPGVQLHLRRFSSLIGTLTPDRLLRDKKAWAATRPDGVTFFFDGGGWPTSIEDRNGNVIRYDYEYRGLTGGSCPVTSGEAPVEVNLLGQYVCTRRLVRVVDPTGVDADPDPDRSGESGENIAKRDQRSLTLTYVNGPSVDLGLAQLVLTSRVQTITSHSAPSFPARVTRFAYDSNGYLTRMTQADGSSYDGLSTARSFDFAYEDAADASNLLLQRKLTRVTDPRGASTKIRYRDAAVPTSDELAGRKVSSIQDRGDAGGPGPTDGCAAHAAGVESTTFCYTAGQSCVSVCTAVTNPRGQTTDYKLDARGRMVEMQDAMPAGRRGKTLLAWDDDTTNDNNVAAVVEGADSHEEAITTMAYTNNGQLVHVEDPLGRTTTFEYGQSYPGTIQSQRTRLGGSSIDAGKTFVEDLTAINRPRGSWSFGRDIYGNVTTQGDPEGNVAETFYDTKGRITHEIDWRSNGATDARTNPRNVTAYCSFDDNGLPQEVWGPRAGATPPADHASRPNCTSAADNNFRTIYRYDVVGNVVQVTDPREAKTGSVDQARSRYTTTLEYDALDRLRRETIPRDSSGASAERRSRTYTYDLNDNLTQETDRNTNTWTRAFTAMDELREARSPSVPHFAAAGGTTSDEEVTRYEYDSVGNLVEETAPEGTKAGATTGSFSTRYEYDAVDRKIVETRRSRGAPTSRQADLVTSYAYDRRGNLIGMTDPRTNEANPASPANNALNGPRRFTYEYDAADNRTASVEDPGGTGRLNLATRYEYDEHDNLVAVTDPRGTVTDASDFRTQFEYDRRDLKTDETDAEGGRTEWELRGDGRVLSRTSPRGTEPGGDANDFRTLFDYYPDGELRSYTLPEAPNQYASGRGTVTFNRDAVGDPTSIEDARGRTFTNTFFDTGELRSTTRPSFWQAQLGKGRGAEVVERDPVDPKAADRGGATGDAESDEPATEPLPQSSGPGADPTAIDDSLPETEGHGDFGDVEPEEMPDPMPLAGSVSFTYDGEMRLTGVRELCDGCTQTIAECGQCTTAIGRDALGRVSSVHRPYDLTASPVRYFVERSHYDRNGNRRRTIDPREDEIPGRQQETVSAFDQYDRLLTRTTPPSTHGSGDTTRNTYDANGNVEMVESPKGVESPAENDFAQRTTYDMLDRVTSRTDGAGNQTTFPSYDRAGNALMIRSPRSNLPTNHADYAAAITTRTFDALNRVATSTDPDGHVTTYAYDANANLERIDQPASRPATAGDPHPTDRTEFTYDGRDFQWVKTTGVGGGDHQRRTVTEYDANGNLRRVVNPLGVTGALPTNADAAPQNTDAGNPAAAGQTAFENATQNATLYEYDADNLLTAMHMPWGTSDPEDRRHWRRDFVRDSRGRVDYMNSAYDWANDVARCREYAESGCTARTSYRYYDTGWIRSATEPFATDPNPPAGETAVRNSGTQVRYAYDGQGNQTEWRVGPDTNRRRFIRRAYWPSGKLSERRGELGHDDQTPLVYTYDWDRNGLLEEMRHHLEDPVQDRVTEFGYDGADRQIWTDEHSFGTGTVREGRDTRVTYDPNGNVTRRLTDGTMPANHEDGYTGGKEMLFEHDALDREVRARTRRDGNTLRSVRTCYMPSGARRFRVRLNSAAFPGCAESAFENDADLRAADSFTYAVDGRVTQKRRDPRTGDTDTYNYEYDRNGNRTRDEKGQHIFNARNHLVRWTRAEGRRNAGTAVDYVVNGMGSVTEKTDHAAQNEGGGVTRFRLVGDRLERVEFTPAGQTTALTTRYTNDDFGNVRVIDPEGAGPVTTYEYDELERMVRSTGPGAMRPARYSYDGLDRRDARCTEYDAGQDICSGISHDFSYVGASERLSEEIPATTAGRRRSYDYDSHLERIGIDSTTAGQTTFKAYATDAQGSVIGLEQGGGEVDTQERYEYDPYGELQRRATQAGQPAPPVDAEQGLNADGRDNPFRFQGFYYDSAVRTYDMRARSYRPEIGRFLTADRFEDSLGDFNLQSDPLTQSRYAFAGGNPVTNVEWDGHEPITSFTQGCSRSYGRVCRGNRSYSQTQFWRRRTARRWMAQRRAGRVRPNCKPRCTDVQSGGSPGYKATATAPVPTGPLARHARCVSSVPREGEGFGGCIRWKVSVPTDKETLELVLTASSVTPTGAGANLGARITGWGARALLGWLRGTKSAKAARAIIAKLRGAKAGSGGSKKVAIGEDMQGRVIPAAKSKGAEYYDPPYLPPAQRMGHNRAWINQKMDEGCTIFDCGAAPGRANFPGPTSPYYRMELEEIARRSYPRYIPPGGSK